MKLTGRKSRKYNMLDIGEGTGFTNFIMNYRDVRKKLRKMLYTEKPYSIFKISKGILRLRIYMAVFLILSVVFYLPEKQYFIYALAILFYAAGFIFFGYLRGVFFGFAPVLFNIVIQKGFFQSNIILIILYFMLLFILFIMLYSRTRRGTYHSNIMIYHRENIIIEFDDAFSQFAPVSDFIKCIAVNVENANEFYPELSYKLIHGAINAAAVTGRKRNYMFVGDMVSIDYKECNAYFYTDPANIKNAEAYIRKYFERFAKLKINISVKDDPDWEIYKNELQPDVYQRQEIYNENYISYLEKRHMDMDGQYKLFYRFKIKAGNQLTYLAEELINLGYKIPPISYGEMKWKDGTPMFIVYKQGKIGQYRVNIISRQFIEIASKYNAEFCDWVIGRDNEYKF